MPDLLAVLYTKLELVETCFVYFCLVLFLGDDQNLSQRRNAMEDWIPLLTMSMISFIYIYIFF